MEDGLEFQNIETGTVAVLILFGCVTFTTVGLATRSWLVGDFRAIWAAMTFLPRKRGGGADIQPLQVQSFVSMFVLFYHLTILGFILLTAYILEHHPPFPHAERTEGSFDADYLIFLLVLLLVVVGLTLRRNEEEIQQESRYDDKVSGDDDPTNMPTRFAPDQQQPSPSFPNANNNDDVPESCEEDGEEEEEEESVFTLEALSIATRKTTTTHVTSKSHASGKSHTSAKSHTSGKSQASGKSQTSGRSETSGRSQTSNASGKSQTSQTSHGSAETIDLQEDLDNKTGRFYGTSKKYKDKPYSVLSILDGEEREDGTVDENDHDGNVQQQRYNYNDFDDDKQSVQRSYASKDSLGRKLDHLLLEELLEEDPIAHIKKPKKSTKTIKEVKPRRDPRPGNNTLLNVYQSREWMGLLSICYLFYQLTDARSSNGRINLFYNAAQVGASCFVFLTAFGHAMYYYTNNDYSLPRVLRVLCRINLTAFWLCLTLGRPYIFYYACPLHSFVFLMTWGTMRVYKLINYSKYGYRAKILLLGLVTFMLWDVNLKLFYLLFFPFVPRGTFPLVGAERGPLWEWYYQTHLQHWIPFVGIIFAANYPVSSLLLEKMENLPSLHCLIAKGMIGSSVAFSMFLWIKGPFRATKSVYDMIHPYFAFVPVLGYVYFRNCTDFGRERHSALLKSVGEYSLELFLLHFHFFLSSDGSTMLVLLPGYPKCNMLLTGILLFALARITQQLTATIGGMLLPLQHEGKTVLSLITISSITMCAYGIAFALSFMGLLNMFVVLVVILVFGHFVYRTIMEMTWAEYRSVGLRLARRSHEIGMVLIAEEEEDGSLTAKASPQLVGAMTIFFVGICWYLMSLAGASTASALLPPSCGMFANDGMWTPVNSCTEYQRGLDFREQAVGSYYRDCESNNSALQQWGWRRQESGSHCRFRRRSRDELQRKLANGRVIFIGDAMVRSLYHGLCRALGDTTVGQFDAHVADQTNDARTIDGVIIEYIWAPLTSEQASKLRELRAAAADTRITLLVAGGGLMDVLHVGATDEDKASLEVSVKKLARELQAIREVSWATVWCTPTTVNTQALFTNEKRTQINEMAISEARKMYARLEVEASVDFVLDGPSYTEGCVADSWDGIQYPLRVYDVGVQIIVNALDWLIPRNIVVESLKPPKTGQLGNAFLGLMMICFGLMGMIFYDGFLGFSYLASLFVRRVEIDDNPKMAQLTTSSLLLMPRDMYEEAIVPYNQSMKLPYYLGDDEDDYDKRFTDEGKVLRVLENAVGTFSNTLAKKKFDLGILRSSHKGDKQSR